MGLIRRIKGWLGMRLASRAKETFGIKPLASGDMDAFIRRCANIYAGKPEWLDSEDDIRTVNMAKSICSETARLAMLGTKITIDGGSDRAAWMQEQVDSIYARLREWVERGCAWGTAILKLDGEGVEALAPDKFVVTAVKGDEIIGAVFISRKYESETERWYTRLEYHRFTPDGTYAISNRCFLGHSETDDGKPVPIDATPWAGMLEDAELENVERPLFAVLRMPGGNNVEPGSALGMPIFADALRELEDLDVAYSRMQTEILDSRRTVLIDDRLIEQSGTRLGKSEKITLPRFVRKAFGFAPDDFYKEINPQLSTEDRMVAIRALLSQIGFKCGFSNGYFVFNESTGMVTATQVESDDRRTVQMVKDVRDKLQSALDGLLYAMDKWADIDDLAPVGAWEAVYDFGDITYNRDEDRARWWGYVTQGKAPAWYFYTKFEGLPEEQARALAAEAEHADDEGVPGAGLGLI